MYENTKVKKHVLLETQFIAGKPMIGHALHTGTQASELDKLAEE